MNPIKKLAVVIVAIGSVSALALSPTLAVAKEKLGDLECGPNEIAKSDGTDWFCADDLNELSQAIEEIGELGCSATQQDNNVLITCGDGTAGVIAGAGTVVLYPEGQIGEVPPIDYNTGPIVLIDGSGSVLAEVYNFWKDIFEFSMSIGNTFSVQVRLINLHSTQQVVPTGTPGRLLFQSEDCSGPAFQSSLFLTEVDNRFFVGVRGAEARALFYSYYYPGSWYDDETGGPPYYQGPSECWSETEIHSAMPVVEYFLPPEIVNAVYPVRIEQLP